MADDSVQRLTAVIGAGPAGLATAAALRARGYFVGYTNPPSGMFREVAIDARRIAAAISRSVMGRTS